MAKKVHLFKDFEEAPKNYTFLGTRTMYAFEAPEIKITNEEIKKASKSLPKPKARLPNTSFMKKFRVSPELAVIVGREPLCRTEIVSKIWDYIKKHNLQNPKNKRNIFADERLLPVFRKKEVSMFELAGLVTKHLKD